MSSSFVTVPAIQGLIGLCKWLHIETRVPCYKRQKAGWEPGNEDKVNTHGASRLQA